MLSVCVFLEVDSLRKERLWGGKWRVSFRLIWPYFVSGHAKVVCCPEGHAVVGVRLGLVIFFFFQRGHKCTKETLVALRKSQINNLGPNDSQVWACRTAICGDTAPLVATLPPQWWHSPQKEYDYVITSAVGRAHSKPQREGRWVLWTYWCAV